MFLKKILLLSFFLFLLSCNKNDELKEIISINNHNDTSYKLTKEKSVIYFRSYSFTEEDTVDSLRITLNHEDWQIINNSYFKNGINDFKNNEKHIGTITNSIDFPEKYILKTNSKVLNITYNYFFNDESTKINKVETEKFVKFLRTCDSLIVMKKIKVQETKDSR